MSAHKLEYEINQANSYGTITVTPADGDTIDIPAGCRTIILNGTEDDVYWFPDPRNYPVGFQFTIHETSGDPTITVKDPRTNGNAINISNSEGFYVIRSFDGDENKAAWMGTKFTHSAT